MEDIVELLDSEDVEITNKELIVRCVEAFESEIRGKNFRTAKEVHDIWG